MMQPMPGMMGMMGMPPGFMPQMQTQAPPVQQETAGATQTTSRPPPSVDELRNLIRGVYERRNPAKLGELTALFTKYAGSEMDVYRHVCQKYGETAEVFAAPQETAPTDE